MAEDVKSNFSQEQIEEANEINDFLTDFIASIIRISEGVTLPEPANDNFSDVGGDDNAA